MDSRVLFLLEAGVAVLLLCWVLLGVLELRLLRLRPTIGALPGVLETCSAEDIAGVVFNRFLRASPRVGDRNEPVGAGGDMTAIEER